MWSQATEDHIKAALPDAIDLATAVLQDYDSYKDIWLKYFPESDHATVTNVFKQIVSDPANPGEGEDRLAICRIGGYDLSKEGFVAPCAGEAAWTLPWPDDYVTDEQPLGSSYTYFCPEAYQQTPKYTSIDCTAFSDTLNDGLDFLGATILHEWLHNDSVGKAVTGTHITDEDGENGYGPYNTRQMLINSPSKCKTNADSYTWLALEVFWTTRQCFTGNGATRFKDPVAPTCANSKRKRDVGECSGLTSAVPNMVSAVPSFPMTLETATSTTSTSTAPTSTITKGPSLDCSYVGVSPSTGVDEAYCDCVVDDSSSTITLSTLDASSAADWCAYSTLPGASASATPTTNVETWTSNCAACTLTGGVGGGQETCTTVSGCTPTASATMVAWVANVGTIDIGNAEDEDDGLSLATEMFGKLSSMCDEDGCQGDHQEMDNVEAAIADGEEPLKPAMFIDAYQYDSLDTLNQMLSVGIGSWISALNNDGLGLCQDVEYEAEADATGSGCGEGPIDTRRLRRKVRRSDGAVLWEREGLAEEDAERQKRCFDTCGSSPMTCTYSARMCNAPDSITVVSGTTDEPYQGHLTIGVTLDATSDGFDCEAIAGTLTAFVAVLAPELLEVDALEGIELEALCGIVDDPTSILATESVTDASVKIVSKKRAVRQGIRRLPKLY
ncbi:hypothetical protein GGR56DRAFT_678416 [Xylariaceae sp. FL0804]|nr:hypothetical protein GGR56DRAFT_678416 [Xylariaceae sp. FL0804]